MSKKGAISLDDLHGDTVVASITVSLSRAGNMSLAGSLTDTAYILYMLETAVQYMKEHEIKRSLGERSQLIVPAYDTALVGTPEEKRLLAARDELSDAMVGR